MQRFVTLALILVFSIPVGLSISGCSKGDSVFFCNGGSDGLQEGQITNIDLEPRLYGISLNNGSIGQISSPNATDCKGNNVGVVRYTYGTTNINYADVSPSGGICAGSWNRNSPGGVADYTTCNPPTAPLLVPVFSTPSAPTAAAGSTASVSYADANGINGNVNVSLAGGPVHTTTITGTTDAIGFAAAFNSSSAFSTFTDTVTFSAPTPATATAGSNAYLVGTGSATTNVNGTVSITVNAHVATGTIASTTGLAGFVAAFNGIPAFSTNGLVASLNGNTVTVSGPVGTANTLAINTPATNLVGNGPAGSLVYAFAVNNTVVVTGPSGPANTLSFTGTNLVGVGYAPAAYVTASAGGAVSNPVPVFIHPIVNSVQLQSQSTCFSQGHSAPLLATVTGNVNGSSMDITAFAGPLNFQPQDGSVVSINSTVVPPIATAQLPGSTILSVNTSSASSPAGIFFTCPPKTITLSVPNAGSNNITLNLNTPQALTTTVVDTAGVTITGLNLEYISTNPRTLNATNGSITANLPGAGAITAICQPGNCNPSPLNQLGQQGNGLPVTSNPIQVTTPGTVNTVLYIASTQSQYFTNIDFSTGVVGSPVRLPYVPNSMISDQAGQTLYFGSASELIQVSSLTNTVTKEDASVKGTVVGVSNDGSEVVISDAVHKLIYIYFPTNGSNISFGGTATHAQFTPDNQSIYITGSDTDGHNFFVYSVFDGWHPYTLSAAAPTDIAVAVPSIGAFLAGATTTERSYCPAAPAFTDFYPEVGTQTAPTDRVAVTNDSRHLLGATITGNLLSDFPLTLSTGTDNPGSCPAFFNLPAPSTKSLGVTPTSITGVIPDADSSVAFVTYTTASSTTTGTTLPAYKPATGTVSQVVLLDGASAPVSGIFSPDGLTFYTGTASDNRVHIITVPTLTDSTTISPALPACAIVDPIGNCTTLGTGTALPNMLANRPRPTT